MSAKIYTNNIDFDFRVGNMRIRVVNISKEFPDAAWFIPEHLHQDYEIHIIESGRGYINIDGEDFIVGDNELYITGPNIMHRQRSDKNNPMTELCIEFSIELIENNGGSYIHSWEESNHLIDVLSQKYTRPFQFKEEILKGFYEIVDNIESKPLGYHQYAQVLIMKLIIDIIRTVASHFKEDRSYNVPKKNVDEVRIEKIKRLVEININNSFTISDAALSIGISPKQINRIMLQHLNMTFHGYLYFFRYKSALNLLTSSSLDISDIAFATGFSGTQQMCRTFRKYAGMSPKEMRKKNTEEASY